MHLPDVADAFEREWGVRLTRGQISGFKRAHGIRNGLVGGRFEKGIEPATKGRRWDEYMSAEAQERCRSTWFKTGEVSGKAADNRVPIGTESVHRDGYVWVKVSDDQYHNEDVGATEAARLRGHNWRQRSHIVYEETYGPIPEGCFVFHADGDPQNDDPENLVAVPLKLKATIAKLGNPYADRETLETAMLMAEVVQAAHRAERGVA